MPLVGIGLKPTLIALVLYGLLAIFKNTIAGLDGVSAPVIKSAPPILPTSSRAASSWACWRSWSMMPWGYLEAQLARRAGRI